MRRRILQASVIAVVCAILLFSVPLGLAILRLYQQDEVQHLQQVAARVAVNVPADVRGHWDPMELPPLRPGTHIGVYDADGRLVRGSGPVRAAGPPDGDLPVREALVGSVSSHRVGSRLVAAVPVGTSERVRAVVRVSSPADGPLHRAAVTWAGMLALAAVAVGVAVALSLRSSLSLARPLEELAATAARLEDGDLTARATVTGLPEADDVARALNRAAQRVAELLRRERSFSADASHQLRTALTRVQLELESVPADAPPAVARAATDATLAALSDMEATLGALLDLARDVPERVSLDVGALLADAERRWRDELTAADRPLRVTAEEDLPEAVGSARAGRQVLDVLLANAVAHGTGAVTVTARDASGVVAVDVADEGPGLPEGLDVFARRQENDSGTGHGIGLALALSLVEAEGGRLMVTRRRPYARFTWLIARGGADTGE
ncbi:ATP-binding protein [Streptomyces sp. NPDC059080]|uniref:HAMP domain-containing sensor histidine kinase n=1 Tax=Streptomyces sp. NPDC059080 TaxID=3346718 RepID=UPI003683515F